ncbi:hypothetical protein BH11PSE11_BH11PSE11_03570 [soil metagenome]
MYAVGKCAATVQEPAGTAVSKVSSQAGIENYLNQDNAMARGYRAAVQGMAVVRNLLTIPFRTRQ